MSANSELVAVLCPECQNVFHEDVSIFHNSRECPVCKKVVMFVRHGSPQGSGGSQGSGWPSPVASDANMAVSAARFLANLIRLYNKALTVISVISLLVSLRGIYNLAAYLVNEGMAGLLTFVYFAIMLALIILGFLIVRAFANWFDGCTRLLAHCGMFLNNLNNKS